MKINRRARMVLILATLAATVLLTSTARAQNKSYWVLYDFGQGNSDGWQPLGVPAVAKNGDLYGVTAGGGTYNYGTVFKLTAPKTRGGRWTKSVLYEFPGGGIQLPTALVIGADGNLYGADGSYNIFELKPPKSYGGAWKYDQLYRLNGNSDGGGIVGIVLDSKGNIYGAAELNGDMSCEQEGCGTVFELKRPTKTGGKWHFSLLHTFTGEPDGALPFAGVTLGQKGNLYGSTNSGGTFGHGIAYCLTPPAKKGRPWTETVLYSFDPINNVGSNPEGPVIFDSAWNMYGTTRFGGDLSCDGFGCGVVYELSPPAKGGAWSYTTLYDFEGGNDGATPAGYMVSDGAGNLYGITEYGGQNENGTIFRLSPSGDGGSPWAESVLHRFTGSDGAVPEGLTWGKWNDLYGVTEDGGTGCQGCGTAFEIRP